MKGRIGGSGVWSCGVRVFSAHVRSTSGLTRSRWTADKFRSWLKVQAHVYFGAPRYWYVGPHAFPFSLIAC